MTRQLVATFLGSIIGGATVMGVFLATNSTLARGTGPDTEYAADGRVFPYRGYLELDGAAVDEAATFGVTLSNGVESYTETHTDVLVYAGEFQLLIGGGASPSAPALPAWVYNTDNVTIALDVNGTPMSNPQEIHPVPYAHWAAEGQDFFVEGVLEVDSIQSSGPAISTSAGTRHDWYIPGAPNGTPTEPYLALDHIGLEIGGNDLVLGVNSNRDPGVRTGQRALVHDTDDVLTVNFGGDFEGGVSVESDLSVSGRLRATGPTRTVAMQRSGGREAAIMPGTTMCPDGEVLLGVEVVTFQGGVSHDVAELQAVCSQ